jgi:hypothetical protein
MLAVVATPTPDPERDAQAWGLCATCLHHVVITSDRGSRFVRCGRARVDPRFPRYPVVPVRRCDGYEAAAPDAGPTD